MGSRRLLGELLVEWGLVTQAQLEQALEWQREDGRRLGILLVERGLVNATKLTQILSHQFHLPFVNLERVRFTAELVAMVPAHLAHSRRLVPICTSGPDVLFLATDDPGDESLVTEASAACQKEIRLMVAAPDQVQEILDTYFPKPVLPPKPRPPGPPPRRPPPEVDSPAPPPPPSVAFAEPMGAMRVAVSQRPPLQDGAAKVVELSDEDLVLMSEPPAPAGPARVLVVEASDKFAEQCSRAAAAQGLTVERAELASATALAVAIRPVALVMMEDVYAMDRVGFTRLSIQTGAHLVIWSDVLGIGYLEPLLAAARQHPPVPAP